MSQRPRPTASGSAAQAGLRHPSPLVRACGAAALTLTAMHALAAATGRWTAAEPASLAAARAGSGSAPGEGARAAAPSDQVLPTPDARSVASHPPAAAAIAPAGDRARAEADAAAAALWSTPDTSDEPRLRTPLDGALAAELLAQAWSDVVGESLDTAGVAVLWAHWAFETARGTRMYGHNFAGLKGAARDGGSALLWTHERMGTEVVLVRRAFRVYRSRREGAEDYVRLLATRYARAARAVSRGDVVAFVLELDERGYFTHQASAYLAGLCGLAAELRTRGPGTSATPSLPDPGSPR